MAASVSTRLEHLLISSFYPATTGGVGFGEMRTYPEGYEYKETVFQEQALAVADEIGAWHDDAEGLLMLEAPASVEFRNAQSFVPPLPLFCVNFG